MKTSFTTNAYSFWRKNYNFMTVVGYIVIILIAIMASADKYLLPVAPYEWLVGLHFIPKTVFGLIILPFVLTAAAHLVELRPGEPNKN